MNWHDTIGKGYLSEDLQVVAETIGLPATRKLMKKFQGTNIYFPKRCDMKYIQDFIKRNYNGDNREEVQKHLGICCSSFYRILDLKIPL